MGFGTSYATIDTSLMASGMKFNFQPFFCSYSFGFPKFGVGNFSFGPSGGYTLPKITSSYSFKGTSSGQTFGVGALSTKGSYQLYKTSSRADFSDLGEVEGDELFEKALAFVLEREGGYANVKGDRGGATNKGITQKTYNAWLKKNGRPQKDVKYITDEEVRQIYYNEYWKPSGCANLPSKVALFIFDTAVNMGVGRAKEYLALYNKGESLEGLFDVREAKYRSLAANDASQKQFLNGWLDRMSELESTIAVA